MGPSRGPLMGQRVRTRWMMWGLVGYGIRAQHLQPSAEQQASLGLCCCPSKSVPRVFVDMTQACFITPIEPRVLSSSAGWQFFIMSMCCHLFGNVPTSSLVPVLLE